MIRSLGTEQRAVDMSRFVVTREPERIPPALNQRRSFSISRSAIVYTGIPFLVAAGTLVGCANPTPVAKINNIDRPACVLPYFVDLHDEERVKEKCELPNFHVNPKLYEHLDVAETDPDLEAVLEVIFSKIFQIPVQAMNKQFDGDLIKNADMYFFGVNSINGYVAQTIINGNHFIFVTNDGNGAWVRLPKDAKMGDPDSGNAEVYQLGDTIIFMPLYRVSNTPVNNATGILIVSEEGLTAGEIIQRINFHTMNSQDWANWVIKRITVYGIQQPFYVYDEKTWEIIETDIDGVERRFPVSPDGEIGNQLAR